MTRRSSRTLIIPIGITLLYLTNVMSGYIQWVNIIALFGITGKSLQKDVMAELRKSCDYGVWDDMSQLVPLVVSDGLLVSTSG